MKPRSPYEVVQLYRVAPNFSDDLGWLRRRVLYPSLCRSARDLKYWV